MGSDRFARGALRLLGLATLAGCDASPTAIDLALVPDPKLDTVSMILARVDAIEVVVDADEGLYFPGEEWSDGTLRIENADADPTDLELVAQVPVPDARMPRIRLERGGLADVPLRLRVVGTSSGAVVAEGRVDGVTFAHGRSTLDVPFDLVPNELPLRVSEVIASPIATCAPPTLTVVFSRPVDPGTVLGPSGIRFDPGGAPASVRLDAAGRIALVTPPLDVVGDGTVIFELELSTAITAADGSPLDQMPTIDGLQPYSGRYDATCAP